MDVEIVARIERRRQWTPEEKAALLAEVEAEGGRVTVVARRHQISASLLYNWRSAWKAAAVAACTPATLEFMPLGVFAGAGGERAAMLAAPTPEQPQQPQISGGSAGGIEIALPNGARVCVDAFVNEQALSRVLRAMKGTT